MNNQPSTSSPFPASQRDISNLKQTATDAVNDLGSTAASHASKASSQVKELAAHVQEEGTQHLEQVKGKLSDVLNSVRGYASENPVTCVATALAIGFFIGLSRSSRN